MPVVGRVGYVIIAYLLAAQTGCIMIRQPGSSSFEPILVGNARASSACDTPCETPCELYDRKEVLKRWLETARPSNIIPDRIQNMGAKIRDHSVQMHANQKQRCDEMVAKCGEWKAWCEMKKREANPPPWPKFHPVPARPAFSRSEFSNMSTPEAYGTIAAP